jgi:predicted kinase
MVRRSMRLFLMCGLAFAGKSTVARSLAARMGAEVVSLDAINAERGLHGGTGMPVEEWARTHQIALGRVRELLAGGASVIVDDTNCYRSLRDRYREAAAKRGVPTTVVVLRVGLEEALARARLNEQTRIRLRVTEAVLRDLAARFEWPHSDEEIVALEPDADLDEWLSRLDR